MKIELGDLVRDKVTGFEGIATSRTQFLNGCFQIGIMKRLKKGEKITEETFEGTAIDEQQLERIGNGINTPKKKVVKTNNGGPMRRVPRSLY